MRTVALARVIAECAMQPVTLFRKAVKSVVMGIVKSLMKLIILVLKIANLSILSLVAEIKDSSA